MYPVHTGTAVRSVEAHGDECLCAFTFRCLHQLFPLRYGNMAWRSMSRPIRVRQRVYRAGTSGTGPGARIALR